jgi:hypothetical protein
MERTSHLLAVMVALATAMSSGTMSESARRVSSSKNTAEDKGPRVAAARKAAEPTYAMHAACRFGRDGAVLLHEDDCGTVRE